MDVRSWVPMRSPARKHCPGRWESRVQAPGLSEHLCESIFASLRLVCNCVPPSQRLLGSGPVSLCVWAAPGARRPR